MVGFDSIIPPGRVGTVTPEVKLHKMRGGSFKKTVTVHSNATNFPDLKLSLGGVLRPLIEVNPSSVQMKPEFDGRVTTDIKLKTEKADLKVNEVYFTTHGKSSVSWDSDAPYYFKYDLAGAGKADKEGLCEYTLSLRLDYKEDVMKHGKLIIKTNHPRKYKIETRASIHKPGK